MAASRVEPAAPPAVDAGNTAESALVLVPQLAHVDRTPLNVSALPVMAETVALPLAESPHMPPPASADVMVSEKGGDAAVRKAGRSSPVRQRSQRSVSPSRQRGRRVSSWDRAGGANRGREGCSSQQRTPDRQSSERRAAGHRSPNRRPSPERRHSRHRSPSRCEDYEKSRHRPESPRRRPSPSYKSGSLGGRGGWRGGRGRGRGGANVVQQVRADLPGMLAVAMQAAQASPSSQLEQVAPPASAPVVPLTPSPTALPPPAPIVPRFSAHSYPTLSWVPPVAGMGREEERRGPNMLFLIPLTQFFMLRLLLCLSQSRGPFLAKCWCPRRRSASFGNWWSASRHSCWFR
ncbi:unnamed protein product [Closterium sp. NIES-53]